MTDRSFETRLEAAFAEAPASTDADVFADAVIRRVEREERLRAAALTGSAVAAGLILLQTLLATRDFPLLVQEWTQQVGGVFIVAGPTGAYAWMAVGLVFAGFALLRGVEA